jgi:hypothetical protein
MLVTPEFMQKINRIQAKLKQGETVSIKNGKFSIEGGPHTSRADRRRLEKLKRQYEGKR